jgi:hypothetical protein
MNGTRRVVAIVRYVVKVFRAFRAQIFSRYASMNAPKVIDEAWASAATVVACAGASAAARSSSRNSCQSRTPSSRFAARTVSCRRIFPFDFG